MCYTCSFSSTFRMKKIPYLNVLHPDDSLNRPNCTTFLQKSTCKADHLEEKPETSMIL